MEKETEAVEVRSLLTLTDEERAAATKKTLLELIDRGLIDLLRPDLLASVLAVDQLAAKCLCKDVCGCKGVCNCPPPD